MGVLLERYVASAQAPLQGRAQLEAGLHADFIVLVVLAVVVLATAIAVLLASKKGRAGEVPAREQVSSG